MSQFFYDFLYDNQACIVWGLALLNLAKEHSMVHIQ